MMGPARCCSPTNAFGGRQCTDTTDPSCGHGDGRVGPRVMGVGPAPATRKVLALTGLTLDQMDVIKLNEAFAAQGLGRTPPSEPLQRPSRQLRHCWR
jgi:hypothetical protein